MIQTRIFDIHSVRTSLLAVGFFSSVGLLRNAFVSVGQVTAKKPKWELPCLFYISVYLKWPLKRKIYQTELSGNIFDGIKLCGKLSFLKMTLLLVECEPTFLCLQKSIATVTKLSISNVRCQVCQYSAVLAGSDSFGILSYLISLYASGDGVDIWHPFCLRFGEKGCMVNYIIPLILISVEIAAISARDFKWLISEHQFAFSCILEIFI